MDLTNKRVLVVGASSGLGRASALGLAREGARVAFSSRRMEPLEAGAKEAGGGAIAVACDVREASSCEAAVVQTVEAFGGLDAIVYATGVARPLLLADADASAWSRSVETNLIGASLITRAAIPHLAETRGRALFLSSITVDDAIPRRGMGLYVVTKTALNRLVEAWQGEHPEISFIRLQVGDTHGTEFGKGWNPEETAHVRDWLDKGLLFGRSMEPEDVAEQVVWALGTREAIPVMVIQPRRALE
ncbi:MAG: SDR family oxidoreductase [bacterium]|nr:SDR family oxidoreductase [bacterium]